MHHLSARSGQGNGGPARVGKQVQHAERFRFGTGDDFLHPIPIYGLFREKPRVLKARGPHNEL